MDRCLSSRGIFCIPPNEIKLRSDDAEGCDTPGRFATGGGGNFRGASQILNLTKEGI